MDDAQKVKAAIDISEYIGRFVQLKKSGRNFTGLCPFHGEKSPSFNVSPEREIFKCFGCGVSGDVISFVMMREGLTFGEALKLLADEAGITLTHKERQDHDKDDRLYSLLEYVSKLYHHLLLTHPSAQPARDYLAKRGFDTTPENGEGREVIAKFQLGFAPNAWRTAQDALLRKGYTIPEMREVGIVTEKNGRTYDMFRNRVIFPLVNRVGKVIGFSGRVLDDSKPKYINTPETILFHKRELLFGFYQAREAIRKNDAIIIVEGEMDMLSSYKVGVQNVSAVKGSSLTPEHIKNIKHLTSNIKLCFDADKAGDMAQIKAIQDAINAGCNVEVINLPAGKDADELIRTDPQQWQQVVSDSKPFYDFLLDSTARRTGTTSAQSKSKFMREIKPLMTNIADPIVQAHYISKIAHTISLPEDDIKKVLNSKLNQYKVGQNKHVQNTESEISNHASSFGIPNSSFDIPHPTAEHYFISLLIHTHKEAQAIQKVLPINAVHDTTLRILYNAIAQYQSVREEQPLQALLARTLQEAQQSTALLDIIYSLPTPEEPEQLVRELRVSALHLARQWVFNALKKVAQELQKAQALGEQQEEAKLQQTLLKLTKHRQMLETYSKDNE